MPFDYRNRQKIIDAYPEIGEALDDLAQQGGNVATQVNASPNGVTQPPVGPSALTVTAAQGIFEAQIIDRNPVSRGINYFLEYSDNPSFTAPKTIDLGQSRNHRVALGNVKLYFRAKSSYPTSASSTPVYHGSQATPLAVIGGGALTGPIALSSEGTGTSNGGTNPAEGGFGLFPTRQK